ncbi:MAG TPA: glycoside hydrolase family 97 C-terminal domain-containing protein [Puia sp.]|nr:glycoside hydrolase family 97 C-terminal domain-containing protein [Puia sp.]
MADHIVTARRHGDNWYIAGMAAEKGYDVGIDFSFLPAGSYKATVCRDGIDAGRNAMDYIMEKKDILPGSKQKIHLAPGGGFVIRLLKE